MMMKKSVVKAVVCFLLLLCTHCIEAKSQIGNIGSAKAHINGESESDTSRITLDNEYKKLLTDSASALEILNDSSEIVDDLTDTVLKFNDFVPQKELDVSLNDEKESFAKSFENVFKVPKTKAKKTLSTRLSSLKNTPVVNDFNIEPHHFPTNDGNSSEFDTYYHAFTHLYDHSKWKIHAFSSDVSEACLRDVKFYLHDLTLSKDWAVKASDASGKYRGLFFFQNSFWLGSKQYCYEIDREFGDEIPRLQFFVIKILVRLEPVSKKQLRKIDVGQCLPSSCTQQDVMTIIDRDPAARVLEQTAFVDGNATKANEVTIVEARTVPGNYSIWRDQKFYVFGVFILLMLVLIIVATIYEESLKSRGFDVHNGGVGEKAENKNHQENFENNNNNSPNNNHKNIKSNMNDSEKYEMSYMHNSINSGEFGSDMEKFQNDRDINELGLGSRLLLCFAFGSNAKVILSARKNSEDSLKCIHGLRLFTLLWTILVHTYLQMFGIGENQFSRNISERTFLYQIVGNATFSVDTFFFISGLLVVFLFLKAEKSKSRKSKDEPVDHKHSSAANRFWANGLWKTSLLIMYRFLRLTPAYFFIMVLTELSMKVTYNQSVFSPGLVDHINCNKYFYRNLFYVNNFYPLSEMCLMWSWYLANDFQFYIITVLLLLVSTRYFKVAAISTVALLIASWLMSIYMSLHYNYIHKVSDPFESFDFLYDKPWQRFGPYAMGMLAGYILYRVKAPPRVPVAINIALWSISLFILFIIIFGVDEGYLNVMATSFYVSLGHTAWGLALIWITLSCCWDLSKPINNLLSFNGFFPLSRLVFCAYLIHPTVMMVTSFQSDGPVQLRHGLIFTAFLGNAAISFVLAFIISLMVEAPTIRLLKVFLKK